MSPTRPTRAAEWIRLPSSDGGAFDAYLALPPAGTGPGLVLFQEIFGVNEHIRAVAEQYALDGFVVLAPDIFWRQQPRVELGYDGEDRNRAMSMMKALQPQQLMADVRDSVAALRARPEAAGRKVGAIGYCLGGRLAFGAAATTDVDAAVAYYGGGIHDQLDKAAGITAPMQFHYAEQDDNIPLSAVEKVRQAFAGKPAEVFVYPGAHHGFNCWARGSYHPASAALAHGRSLAFLAERLF
ncbi:dienelactone hydrolase family protein [Aquabacterium sp. J223]|uniref:dienelactone hydrolase family protein n=1 Tax=Aquabacterium sp. J223 TaxID=2898431 RepID=UPI0021ADA949|nr:dienelactone hydrolase family protein [Aquabacterium sp. J223]UUX97141.1 dienelactone hydrolase family protein [Aquabacterium sp. J223]